MTGHRREAIQVAVGVRANLAQFALLTLVTAFVGITVGLERAVVPLMAGPDFGVESVFVTLTFISAFGAAKAVSNFLAGWLADHNGRKALLVGGWLAALPVPLLIGFAPNWGWVVAANLLLGVNQGLCWTMTLVMMSDLSGRPRRGLAIGINELTGYVAISVAALASAPLSAAHGARSFLLAAGLAVAVAGSLTSLRARDTLVHARAMLPPGTAPLTGEWRAIPVRVLVPRRQPGLVACYQAGFVTKVNDAGVWGLAPLLLTARGFSIGEIGLVVAVYPFVWGWGQGLTGPLSDVVDRRPLVVGGLATQAVGLAVLAAADSVATAVSASATLGVGTAMVYPTLLAAVRDVAPGRWEASAFGAYRLWRDTGFVLGALGVGALADAAGMGAALTGAALVSVGSAIVTLRLMPRHLAGGPARAGDPVTTP